jgi:hypothetical protein
MGNFVKPVSVAIVAAVACLAVASPALGDPIVNPGQPWHSTHFTKSGFTSTIGYPLFYSPAQPCFGTEGWIGADFSGSLFANQADPTSAHVMGTVTMTFWVRFNLGGQPPNSYEAQATLAVNDFVVASQFVDQGYIEYPMPVDMVPAGGGSAIPVIFPVQIWVAWSPDWTVATASIGQESCA